MTNDHAPFLSPDPETDDEPHTLSPTAHLLDELALHGHRPGQDEPDPRPLPEADTVRAHIGEIADGLAAMLTDTRLEDDLADVLWSFVNLFHRKAERLEAELDRNEQAQKRGQAEQDGSEVKSVELERLIAQGISLIERRNAFEFVRDHAAELYEAATGSAWRPHTGSMVNHRALTAAVIDSREFLAARRRADAQVLAPSGPRIAFTGGADCNDHTRIWDVLDKVRIKHPDMVLLHGGSPRGAERIAACWADNRQVPQIVFKPDWTHDRNAAPVQAQRPDARSAADRRRRLPRLRHCRQPRRQGQKARHPDLALRPAGQTRRRRCLGAALSLDADGAGTIEAAARVCRAVILAVWLPVSGAAYLLLGPVANVPSV
jgi:YspA, cpYpsA-related SLOG family